MKIPFKDRSQMTMKEKIANPLSIEKALEISEKCQVPRDNYWGDLCLTDFEKSVWGLFESDLLLYSKKKLKEKLVTGEYLDIIPSFGGSDVSYFADMILEPIEKFNATHFHDGREKKKGGSPY